MSHTTSRVEADTHEAQPDHRGISRRTVLGGGLVLGAAKLLHLPQAAYAQVTYDPRQRFVRLVGGGNGTIYAVQADGRLLWYRNMGWATVTASWANSGRGRQIGTGWAQFRTVMADADGTIFALRSDGDLLWYRYVCTNLETGAGYWAAHSGSRIGHGFDTFPRVFGGYDGVIWGIDGAGDLFWNRYLRKDGLMTGAAWAGGTKVGTGWYGIGDVVADTGGVLYAMAGSLRWYRYIDGGPGHRYWAAGGGRIIGSGWRVNTQKAAVCAGSGAIYRVALDTGPVPDRDDRLIGYRLTNWKTAGSQGPNWSSRNGTVVGTGFTVEATAALQGYSTTLDVRRGSRATFATSSTFASFTASVQRLGPGAGVVQVRDPVTVSGRLRLLPSDYRSAGCRWPDSFAVDVPADWPSGLYAVRLEGPHGLQHLIPFTVRPVQPSTPIAVLFPTNTYRAYEFWGGHNQYTVGEVGRQRTMSLLQPYANVPTTAYGLRDHTWYSDQLLLRWMAGQGIDFDAYEDQDLHLSADWLLGYRALVLTTHPEYWTETMRSNLIGWLATGGRLIYTGGNGIYERVSYDPDRKALTFRRSDGARDVYREAGLPESQILGVAYDSSTYGTLAPFKVTRDHPLFEGTGLSVGDTFGASGYNGPASGLEVDARLGLAGDASDEEVIAEGLHSRPSAMVFMERPNGGFVFSAGSLSFNGALSDDARMSRLLRNVFDRAVAPNPQQLA
ncbi:MAG TPA: N,N-dimethylformamidase beta subunit family domain-containing protein, partial [Actinomycetes bacterium]